MKRTICATIAIILFFLAFGLVGSAECYHDMSYLPKALYALTGSALMLWRLEK